MTFRLGAHTTASVPPDPQPLDVLVDGVAENPSGRILALLERTYPTYAEAQTHTFAVEVYLDDTLLSRREETPGECGVIFDDVPPLDTESVGLCVHENGELRYGSVLCESPNWNGAGDGFCHPRCDPLRQQDQCGDEKCGLRVKLADPYYAHVACVPIGAQQVGQPCVIDGDGHDDCIEGAGCYDGQCRAWCSMQTGGCGAQTCTALPRITDGFRVCM